MYNDTIKVANKIISDKALFDIFQAMDEEIRENIQICKKETLENEKYERKYQHWTAKDFEGTIKCTFDFYDDTSITTDKYSSLITTFNNRLPEIKSMWVRCHYSYRIKNEYEDEYISQTIEMNIKEHKISIDVKLNSKDKKMNRIYELIKEKIQKAPVKYSRIIQKKSSISNKMFFSYGIVPSMIICALLIFVPAIRNIYGTTYILYPLAAIILALLIGGTMLGGTIDRLYKPLSPKQKYAGYDSDKNKSIYKDDIDDYLSTSEVIIGKNANNISNRREIMRLEKEYKQSFNIKLIALFVTSVVIVIICKIV